MMGQTSEPMGPDDLKAYRKSHAVYTGETTVHISLVMDDWQRNGKPVDRDTYHHLSTGDLHSGSTFPATITLPQDTADELLLAMCKGYRPVMWISTAKGLPHND